MRFNKILDSISMDELMKTVKYNPDSGEFEWIRGYASRKPGAKAGTLSGNGYLRMNLNGKLFSCHRVAWLMHYGVEPEGMIDHINGNKTDNRISNLRLANYSQNSMNSRISRLNTSGCKGVSWKKESNKWVAVAKLNGKKIHLGYFLNFDDAKKAYCDFAIKHHGEYYRSK